jgi:hypothetical protein
MAKNSSNSSVQTLRVEPRNRDSGDEEAVGYGIGSGKLSCPMEKSVSRRFERALSARKNAAGSRKRRKLSKRHLSDLRISGQNLMAQKLQDAADPPTI